MHIVFVIFVVIAAIAGLILIFVLFSPDEFTIQRSIIINRPIGEVYGYIKRLKNQLQYNKWIMTDPDAQMTYTGTDGQLGFIMEWDSANKKVGAGAQEISRLLDKDRIECEIRFKRPFENNSKTWMTTTTSAAGQTEVTWYFNGSLNFTMKLMHLVLNLKNALGKDIDTSLNNLKSNLENN